MHLIRSRSAREDRDPALPIVPIRVDRHKLARRRWRGRAADGTEFGFDLEEPLRHGDAVWPTEAACYAIEQEPEPVLEIPLAEAPDAAAVLGWAVGNLHFGIEAGPGFLRTADDVALRQMLQRLGIAFRENTAVFQPHHLARMLGANGSHTHALADPSSTDANPWSGSRPTIVVRPAPTHVEADATPV